MKTEYDNAGIKQKIEWWKSDLLMFKNSVEGYTKDIEGYKKDISELPNTIKATKAEMEAAYDKLPKGGLFFSGRPKKGKPFKDTKKGNEYNDAGIAYNQLVSKLKNLKENEKKRLTDIIKNIIAI